MKSYMMLMFLLPLLTGTLRSEVKPNTLFSDGAVLQRGQKIPVWGTAHDGEKITVEFQGQKVTTTAAHGKWSVHLDPLTEGGPFTMTLTGDNTVTINNLLVGEVWLCSGQSNMNMLFNRVHNAAEEAPKANYPEIRTFKVPTTISATPLPEAKGSWVACSPETVNDFSGVAYFFARDIHRKLGVPVGLIHSALGATPAQAWTSLEGLKSEPELREYVEIVKRRLANYDAEAAAYPAILAAHQAKLAAWNEAAENAKASGQKPPPRPRPTTRRPPDPVPPDGRSTDPAVLFNGMINPLIPYGGMPPEIREAQLLSLGKVKNAAMTVTTDVGDADDIHPKKKEPIGQRLALAARALAYGEKIEYSGPLYDSMEVENGKVVLDFKHTGSGLVAKAGPLKGFTIAGKDMQFVPARAEIQGNRIAVSAEGVTDPQAVRYGWANLPDGNLYNQEGLPASPFRTDVE